MAEHGGNNLPDANNRSTSPAGKVKTSAANLWSLICSIGGWLMLLIVFFLLYFGIFGEGIVFASVLVGFALGTIGLILGIISKRPHGLIMNTILILVCTLLFMPHTDSHSKEKDARIQIASFDEALTLFGSDLGRCPTQAEGLDALIKNTTNSDSWKGPYLKNVLPLDPWGRPYQYRNPGRHDDYDIYSLGQDGQEGTNDDVGNWTTN
jgi:general secretion pathway protein G